MKIYRMKHGYNTEQSIPSLALVFYAIFGIKIHSCERSVAKRSGAEQVSQESFLLVYMGQKNNCVSQKRSILGLWFIEEKMIVFAP